MKKVLNLPKITISYSWKCLPKQPTKFKTLSKKTPSFSWTKFKKAPLISKMTLPESRSVMPSKRLTKKFSHPRLSNPKKKKRDGADQSKPFSLL